MSTTQVKVPGVLRPDGTLELSRAIGLPPGPVQVTVEVPAPSDPAEEDTWTVLERIWAERKALGMQPRSAEEIDAGLNAMRDEWEQRQQARERIPEAARQALI